MTKRFCCCNRDGNICCGDLTSTGGWINGPPSGDRFYRIAIPLSFSNSYSAQYPIGTEHPGEIDCSIGGGCGGCFYELPAPSLGFGTSGGLFSLCLGHHCGPCKNGMTDPETGIEVPGSSGTCGPSCADDPSACVGVCLPFDWEEVCCGSDGSGGTDCGARPSVLSLNEVLTPQGFGSCNFTIKTRFAYDPNCFCRNCETTCEAGEPGFDTGTGSLSVPASFYVSDTEYQDTRWNGGSSSGDPCGGIANCVQPSLRFACADSMAESSGAWRYLTPLSVQRTVPLGSMPYIDLEDYPGAYVALLSVTHIFETQDTLVVVGDNCTGYSEDQGSDGSVTLSVGYVGACRPGGVDFVPFGTIGARHSEDTADFDFQSFSAGAFSISFDLDKWET